MGLENHLLDHLRFEEKSRRPLNRGPDALAASVRALFAPLPVVVESQVLGWEVSEMEDEEARQVAGAVAFRRAEFASGRACARRAMAQLGIRGFSLLNGADRAPRWPAGIVGSITHTGPVPGGYCGVAVGRAADVRAVGLDAEGERQVAEELWPSILTASERGRLREQPAAMRATWVRLVFSAKECFYKAQFPLTGAFLDFHDVETCIDPDAHTFDAWIRDPPRTHPVPGSRGRYLETADLVVTGIAVAA